MAVIEKRTIAIIERQYNLEKEEESGSEYKTAISKEEARAAIRGLFTSIGQIANPALEPEPELVYEEVDEEADEEIIRLTVGLGERITNLGVRANIIEVLRNNRYNVGS